jgi:hypothetical protein
VVVVDGATHTQNDDVEGNGGSLENTEIFWTMLSGEGGSACGDWRCC